MFKEDFREFWDVCRSEMRLFQTFPGAKSWNAHGCTTQKSRQSREARGPSFPVFLYTFFWEILIFFDPISFLSGKELQIPSGWNLLDLLKQGLSGHQKNDGKDGKPMVCQKWEFSCEYMMNLKNYNHGILDYGPHILPKFLRPFNQLKVEPLWGDGPWSSRGDGSLLEDMRSFLSGWHVFASELLPWSKQVFWMTLDKQIELLP